MKQWRYTLIGGLIVIGAAAVFLIFANYSDWKPGVTDSGSNGTPGAHTFLPRNPKQRVHLYFSDENNGYLAAEEHLLSLPDDTVGQARQVVEALIDGPKSHLRPTIPGKTKLLAIYVTERGIAYVNFDETIRRDHPGGTFAELLTIFSVVNTLCLNISDIYAVKILVDGKEKKTLSGHIDIEKPLKPNLLMLKG
jgi:spore germination protein GerM